MELEQIVKEKDALRLKINQAIKEFQDSTNCNPRIRFIEIEIGAISGPRPKRIIDTEIEVVL